MVEFKRVIIVFSVLAAIYLITYAIAFSHMDDAHPQEGLWWINLITIPLGFPLLVMWSWIGADYLKTVIPEGVMFLAFSVVDLGLWSWLIACGIGWTIRRSSR